MKILWVIDNKLRELYGLYDLKKSLKKKNIDLIITSKANWLSSIKFFQPNILVVPNIKSLGKSIINYCFKNKIITCHYSSEGLNYQKSKLTELYPIKYTELFDYLFCWSEEEKFFLDNLGFNKKTLLIGNFKYNKKNLKFKEDNLSIKTVGIATSLRYFASRYEKNIFAVIGKRLNNSRGRGTLHNEIDYIFFITILIEKLLNVGLKVIIRPHPFEDPKIYKKTFKSCDIDENANAYEFIENVDLIINQFSSISVEAAYAHKPVISIIDNISLHDGVSFMEGFIPAHIGKKLDSFDDIIKFIISKNNKLIDYFSEKNLSQIQRIAPNLDTVSVLTNFFNSLNYTSDKKNYAYLLEYILKEIYIFINRPGGTSYSILNPLDTNLLKKFKI